MNKIILFLSISFFITNAMAQEKIVQTAGRTQLGRFAPKLRNLTMMSFSVKYGAGLTSSVCVIAVW